MAEPVKRGDVYRHEFMLKGVRYSATYPTKRECREWEATVRIAVGSGQVIKQPVKHKLSAAIDKYVSTISTMKRDGAVTRETRRFNAMLGYFGAGVYIEDITSDMVAKWRTERLQTVKASSVNRDWNLYGNLFNVARKEWKWVKENPFSEVKRPPDPPPRETVWRWKDILAILREGKKRGGKYLEVTQAFRIALHTATRLQEALTVPARFNPENGVFTLGARKESISTISVPTLPRARRVIMSMPKKFEVGANEASVLFCDLRSQLGISNKLQFRDSRATALTLMSKKMDVKTLKRISRHKDINILINTYYRETAEEISNRL